MWECTPIIPVFGSWRQESKFKASVGHLKLLTQTKQKQLKTNIKETEAQWIKVPPDTLTLIPTIYMLKGED